MMKVKFSITSSHCGNFFLQKLAYFLNIYRNDIVSRLKYHVYFGGWGKTRKTSFGEGNGTRNSLQKIF